LQKPIEKQHKQPDLELLQQAAREGHVTLKYLDESGFDCWSPVSHMFQRTGKITVIVQDEARIHTSQAVQQRIALWQQKGLYLFYLPRYSSELNPIEGEWHQIKVHQIRGRMFEDEYDLAMAVIASVQSRGAITACRVKRFGFKFNKSRKQTSRSSV
jgi:transposase